MTKSNLGGEGLFQLTVVVYNEKKWYHKLKAEPGWTVWSKSMDEDFLLACSSWLAHFSFLKLPGSPIQVRHCPWCSTPSVINHTHTQKKNQCNFWDFFLNFVFIMFRDSFMWHEFLKVLQICFVLWYNLTWMNVACVPKYSTHYTQCWMKCSVSCRCFCLKILFKFSIYLLIFK